MSNIIDFKKYYDRKYNNRIDKDFFIKILADSFEINISDIDQKSNKD